MTDVSPRVIAEDLCRTAGLAVPLTVEPHAGGRNNRIFRLDFNDGSRAMLKCYHHDPRDPRDRLKTEWSFVTYVWQHGIRNVPQPLAKHAGHHAALYGFVAGEHAGTLTPALIAQAVDFIAAINDRPADPQFLAAASEACFSLADHVTIVERRVGRLVDLDAKAPHVEKARNLVATRLAPAWKCIRADIERQAVGSGVALTQTIAREIVSPSDFGFHNVLVGAEGRANFLDFEYAGRDDPAKLVCDFFCQPDIPVPSEYYSAFTQQLAERIDLHAGDLWRADMLLDAYRIKWVCIMLNEFLPVDASRRAFAACGDREARAAHQLRSAEQYLALIKS